MNKNLKTRIKDFWEEHKTKFVVGGTAIMTLLTIWGVNKFWNGVKADCQISEQKMRDACAKVGITFEQFESILDAADK